MLQTVDLLKKVHTIDPKTWKEHYNDMYVLQKFAM